MQTLAAFKPNKGLKTVLIFTCASPSVSVQSCTMGTNAGVTTMGVSTDVLTESVTIQSTLIYVLEVQIYDMQVIPMKIKWQMFLAAEIRY